MVEEIITRYLAEDQYSSVVMKATRRTKEFDTAAEQVKKRTKRGGLLAGISDDFKRLDKDLGGISSAFASFGVIVDTVLAPVKMVGAAILGAVGAAAVLGTTFSGFAAEALGARAEVDSLMRALTASTGSAEKAASEYEKLFRLAKSPGLGDVTDTVEGQLRFNSVGFSAEFAKEAILQVGNALALVGKGQAEVDGVTMALTQIESKGIVSAEEINQLAERLPMIRKLMKDAFGTSSTEELQRLHISSTVFIEGLVRQMGRLERATPGIRTELDNLGAAYKVAFADAGKAIEEDFLPGISKLSTMVENMASNESFKNIAQEWGKIFGGGNDDFFVTAASYVFAVAQAMPTMIQMAVDTAKEGMLWIYNLVKNTVQIAANVTGQGETVRRMVEELEGMATGKVSETSPLGMILASIENAAAGFRAMADQPNVDQGDPLPNAVKMALDQSSPLAKIERNTKVAAESLTKQEQIYQRMIGGGGRAAISATELGSLGSGRGNKVERAYKYFLAAVRQESQGSVMDNILSRARMGY